MYMSGLLINNNWACILKTMTACRQGPTYIRMKNFTLLISVLKATSELQLRSFVKPVRIKDT